MEYYTRNKRLFASCVVFFLSLIYFTLNYTFYLPITLSFSGQAKEGSKVDIFFDSGDGYTSYEKITVDLLDYLELSKTDQSLQSFSQTRILPNVAIKKIKLEISPLSNLELVKVDTLSLQSELQEITVADLRINKELIPEIGTTSIKTKIFHKGIFLLQIVLALLVSYSFYELYFLPKKLNKQTWKDTLRFLVLEEKRSFFWIALISSLLVHLIWLLAFWPGAMTNDSWASYYEVRSLDIKDWHPYIYAIYIMSLLQFYNSVAAVGMFQIFITAVTCNYIFYYCYKNNVSLLIILPFLLLFIFSIPIGLMNIIIWKDIPFSIMVLILSFTLYLARRNKEFKGEFIKFPKWGLIWLFLGIILLLHSRHNGNIFYAALPLLFITNISKKHICFLTLFLVCSFITIKKVIPSIYEIKAPVGSAYHELKTILSIMTHVSYYSETREQDIKVVEDFVGDSWENISKDFPVRWFSINDHPAVTRHQFAYSEDDPTNIKKSFIIKLILENIPIFIGARTFEFFHSIGLDFSGCDERNNYYEDPLQLQGSNLGPPGQMIFNVSIKAEPKLPESIVSKIRSIDLWARSFNGVFKPSIIVWNLAGFLLIFLLIILAERSSSAIFLFTLPSWISAFSIFLLGPGESWRYFYYIYLCGIVIIPLYCEYLKNKPKRLN